MRFSATFYITYHFLRKEILFIFFSSSFFDFSKISEQSPHQILSAAIATFLGSHDMEQRNQAEQFLIAWQNNPQSLDLALEIIQISMSLNEIFFSGQAVNYIIMNFSEDMNQEQLTRVFTTLHNRYLHSLPPGLDEKCNNIICKNLACISALHPEFLDADWNGADINSVLLYFAFLIEFQEEHNKNCPDSFKEKLYGLRPLLLKFLTESPLSAAWIDVLRFLFISQEDEDAGLSIIWGFEGLLNQIPGHPELYSKFFDLFKELYQDYYYEGFDVNNYPRLNQFFMTIFMQILEILFSKSDDPEQAISFSSFVWEEIMDDNPDLFTDFFPEQFTIEIFQKFIENLRFIADVNSNEFLWVVEPASNKIPELIKRKIEFLPIWFSFLDQIIYAIDNHYEEYMVCDSNQVNPIEDSISSAYTNLFDKITEEMGTAISTQLIEYFVEKLKTISDGVIFVITTAPKQITQPIIPLLAQIILGMNPIPNSALWFIKQFHVMVGPKNLPGVISLSYSSFIQSPSIQSLEAISMLALHLPKFFIENSAKLINPLLEWLNQSPPQFLPYIMICLMYIIVRLNPEEPNAGQLLSIINGIIMKGLQILLETNVPQSFAYLNDLLTVITPLFKKDGENDGFIHFNISETHKPLATYFYQLFQQIVEMMAPLWTMQSDQVISELCEFVSHAIDVGIVTDYEQIVNWIGQALYIAPVTEHITLLTKIQTIENTLHRDLIVTEPIMKFLVSFPQIQDTELQRTVYSFIYNRLFLEKKPYFFNFFTIDLMMSPLTSTDQRMGNLVFQFIQNIIFSDFYEFDLGKFLSMIIECMFTIFQRESIKETIEILLKVIENEKCSAQDILQLIAGHLSYESAEAIKFQQEFHSQPYDQDRIFKAALKMVLVYRNSPAPTQ